jgi:predicted TPR repeat methyltransferase
MEEQSVREVAQDGILGTQWGGLRTFVRAFSAVARPEDHCLEIGAGGGRLTAEIAPMVAELTAADISDSMFHAVRRAVRAETKLSFLVLDKRGDNLPRERFDIVAAADVLTLFTFPDLVPYAKKVFQSLRPGGHFVCSVKTLDDDGELNRYLEILDAQPYHDVHRMPTVAYMRLFANAGFELVDAVRNAPEEEFEPGPLHLNLVLQRPPLG